MSQVDEGFMVMVNDKLSYITLLSQFCKFVCDFSSIKYIISY